MDFEPIPGLAEARKKYDDFFREEMKKAPPGWEGGPEDLATHEGHAFQRYVARELGKRGWVCLAWPKKYGGLEKSHFEQLAFNEARAYWKAPGVDQFGAGMIGPTLLAVGSEEQKERFLPPIARGEIWWAQLWSEPNAGSDLAAAQTFAQREGDDYIVNGQKCWTSGAHHADWGFAVVRTSREQTRSRALSYLLIDLRSQGITINPLATMSSHRTQEAYFNEIFLDNVRVPVVNRVGEENDGWRMIRATMNFERSGLSAYGAMRRELLELIEFCRETKWQGEPLLNKPLVRDRLAQLAIDIEAGMASARHVLWGQYKLFLGEESPRDQATRSSSLKYYRSELSQRFAYTGCQIFGLYSQLKRESRWAPLYGKFEKEYQSCLGNNIASGTTEIQKNIIAWEGLGLPRI
ncbi:MAG: acyl-CoA dehydrogenase family protein [Chloroflexi bacterium]|nr:acyl-CoA dehydrogenase family protein [Chloroflexota bacterium]